MSFMISLNERTNGHYFALCGQKGNCNHQCITQRVKVVIKSLFCRHDELSLSRQPGKCYDGANNIQGEFNGLEDLILRENQSNILCQFLCSSTFLIFFFFFCLVDNFLNIDGG